MKLVGTSGTEEGIRRIIAQYFFRTSADDVLLIPSKVDSNICHIELGGKRILQHCQVRTEGWRLRFEHLEDPK